MDDVRELLRRTADLAADFLDSLDDRPVFPRVSPEQLRLSLGGPLPDEPTDPQEVVEGLAAGAPRRSRRTGSRPRGTRTRGCTSAARRPPSWRGSTATGSATCSGCRRT